MISTKKISIVWFRLDLRIRDNPALHRAIESGDAVVPIYLHTPLEKNQWPMGAASKWWLHHSLLALAAELKIIGLELILREAPNCLSGLQAVIEATKAHRVFWNRRYEPDFIARDKLIKTRLREGQIEVESCSADLWIEPWQIATDAGQPYRVFTPFWRKLKNRLSEFLPQPMPEYKEALVKIQSEKIAAFKLLPDRSWDKQFYDFWQPGEIGASENLDQFLSGDVSKYKEARDVPSIQATSRLSPHLAFGEISPRQILARCIEQLSKQSSDPFSRVEPFLRELGWREFSKHLLFHFPHTCNENLNPRFVHFNWQSIEKNTAAKTQLVAWQRGQTGVPIVDAGMRELWQTGWMHNRVRMIVASFLTKNIRAHWLHGARWFWDTLVDADLANNTQGWQWTAGTGADAAPYFRIFNPVSQAQRFDPKGVYVRRWVPELKNLPDRYLYAPWTAPAAVRELASVSNQTYPDPIVDLAISRADALQAFKNLRE